MTTLQHYTMFSMSPDGRFFCGMYAEGARTQELFAGCSTEKQEWPSSGA